MMMKNKFTLIAIAIAIGFSAQAQDGSGNRTDYREKFMGGFKLGGNYSNVYDTKGEEFTTDPKTGWVFGGFLSIPMNELVGVNIEALFSQKGYKGKGRILGGNYEMTRTTNYLDFPIFITLKPSEFISLLGGFQYSYLLKQTDQFKAGVTTIEQEQEFLRGGIRRNTFCVVGGADVNLKHMVLGFRAGVDVLNNDGTDLSTSTPRYRNMWLQFTVGYRLYQTD
jgi:hypothetical protein